MPCNSKPNKPSAHKPNKPSAHKPANTHKPILHAAHLRANAAFRAAKTQERIEAAFRIAAKMQHRKTR